MKFEQTVTAGQFKRFLNFTNIMRALLQAALRLHLEQNKKVHEKCTKIGWLCRGRRAGSEAIGCK